MDRNKLSSGDHYIIHQHQKHRKYKKKYQRNIIHVNENLEPYQPSTTTAIL